MLMQPQFVPPRHPLERRDFHVHNPLSRPIHDAPGSRGVLRARDRLTACLQWQRLGAHRVRQRPPDNLPAERIGLQTPPAQVRAQVRRPWWTRRDGGTTSGFASHPAMHQPGGLLPPNANALPSKGVPHFSHPIHTEVTCVHLFDALHQHRVPAGALGSKVSIVRLRDTTFLMGLLCPGFPIYSDGTKLRALHSFNYLPHTWYRKTGKETDWIIYVMIIRILSKNATYYPNRGIDLPICR